MRTTRTALMGAGVTAALIAGLACAAPGGHHATTSPPAAPSAASGARYKDVESLIAAMAVKGAPCTSVSFVNGGTVPGSVNPYVDCSSAASNGDTIVDDTVVIMFAGHPGALAYAHRMLATATSVGTAGTPNAEVVGPNWVVNTIPTFAKKVVQAVGGQLMISDSTASSSPSAAVTQPASPKPVVRVHFIVTGTGLPSITYGSDSDNRSPSGGLGVLGDGNQLPWRASMKFDPSAQYYSLNAQLEGDGSISCKIVVTAGASYTKITVSHGHASGGYNICSAQAAPTDTTGLNWQNEQ